MSDTSLISVGQELTRVIATGTIGPPGEPGPTGPAGPTGPSGAEDLEDFFIDPVGMFSADPTGATPSTIAHANAMSYAKTIRDAGGQPPPIVYPPGRFVGAFTAEPGIECRGSGKLLTIFQAAVGQTAPIWSNPVGTTLASTVLKNFYIRGNRQSGGNEEGMYLNSAGAAGAGDFCEIHDIWAFNTGSHAFHFGRMTEPQISGLNSFWAGDVGLYCDIGFKDAYVSHISIGASWGMYNVLVSGSAPGGQFNHCQSWFNKHLDESGLPDGIGWAVYGDGVILTDCVSEDNHLGLIAGGTIHAKNFQSQGDQWGCRVDTQGTHGGRHVNIEMKVLSNDRWLPEKGFIIGPGVEYANLVLDVGRYSATTPLQRNDNVVTGDHDGSTLTALSSGHLNVADNFICFDITDANTFVGCDFKVVGINGTQFVSASVSAPTKIIDVLNGCNVFITLDNNLALSLKDWSACPTGTDLYIVATQSGAGSYALTFDPVYFGTSAPIVPTGGAGKYRRYHFRCTDFQSPLYPGTPFFTLVSTKDSESDPDLNHYYTKTQQNDLLPWHIERWYGNAKDDVAHVGTWTIFASASMMGGGYVFNSSDAQNDSWSDDFVLSAGTWKLVVMGTKAATFAISTLDLDGASLTSLGGSATTMDWYNGTQSNSQVQVITGIVIPTAGKKRLRQLLTTRNALNTTHWFVALEQLVWVRTA